MKKTAWFPPEIKPVHDGVYETDYWRPEGRAYAKWSRHSGWSWAASTPKQAAREIFSAADQDKGWRGLAEPAK